MKIVQILKIPKVNESETPFSIYWAHKFVGDLGPSSTSQKVGGLKPAPPGSVVPEYIQYPASKLSQVRYTKAESGNFISYVALIFKRAWPYSREVLCSFGHEYFILMSNKYNGQTLNTEEFWQVSDFFYNALSSYLTKSHNFVSSILVTSSL